MRRRKSIALRVLYSLFGFGLGILLLTGAVLYVEVKAMLFAALDQDLESDLDLFTGLVQVDAGNLTFRPAETIGGRFSIPRSGHYYQIEMQQEGVIRSVSLAGTQLAPRPDQRVRRDEIAGFAVYNLTGPAGEPLRVMERAVVFAGQPARIIVAHSLGSVVTMLGRLRRFLALQGIIGALAIGLLGGAISRGALGPLRNFALHVHRVRDLPTDVRLDPARLHQEVSALADAFNAMLGRLRKAFEAREKLLSDVSHELKTPVTVIRSHCDVYLQRGREPAEYIEALEIIRETADTMGGKIRRLLASASADADLFQAGPPGPVDVATCLRQAWVLHEAEAREKGIAVSEQVPPNLQVWGHRDRITEAFSCLLDNAVKYMDRGGTVEIVATTDADQVDVRFSDTGPGLSGFELDRVFERFYRGDRASDAEGAGLGLSIVKSIVEAHGGSVTVESVVDRGSTFRVRLPGAGRGKQRTL